MQHAGCLRGVRRTHWQTVHRGRSGDGPPCSRLDRVAVCSPAWGQKRHAIHRGHPGASRTAVRFRFHFGGAKDGLAYAIRPSESTPHTVMPAQGGHPRAVVLGETPVGSRLRGNDAERGRNGRDRSQWLLCVPICRSRSIATLPMSGMNRTAVRLSRDPFISTPRR